jgi:biotin carboxyl carrier protein
MDAGGAPRGAEVRTRVTLVIGEALHEVEVSVDNPGFRIKINEETLPVDAAELAPGRWSLLVGAGRVSHDIRLQNDRPGEWTVFVDGRRVAVSVRAPGRARQGTRVVSDGDGPERVAAPMPGKIVRLLVAPGETVVKGQGVAVVEAMKMENELRARRSGTVLDVLVREGASIEAGAAVMVIG